MRHMFPLAMVTRNLIGQWIHTHQSPRPYTLKAWLSGQGIVGWKSTKLVYSLSVPMTNASSARLPLGSLDVKTDLDHPFGWATCAANAIASRRVGTQHRYNYTPTRRTRTKAEGRWIRRVKRQGSSRPQKDSACIRLTKDVQGGGHFCNTRAPLVLQVNTRFCA